MTVIICPACNTRFETAAVIPPTGRKVRCSKCGNVWQAMAVIEPAKPAVVSAPTPPPVQPRAGAELPPRRAPEPRPAARRRVQRRRNLVPVRRDWATPWAAFPVSRVLRRSRPTACAERPAATAGEARGAAVQHRRRDAARSARRRFRIDRRHGSEFARGSAGPRISAATTPEPWSIRMPDWPPTCPSPKAASGSCRLPSPLAGACSRSCSSCLPPSSRSRRRPWCRCCPARRGSMP